MNRRTKIIAVLAVIAALITLMAGLFAAPNFPLFIGEFEIVVPSALLLVIAFTAGGLIGLGFSRAMSPRAAHDPKLLLPRMLSKKVRQSIDDGYRTGNLESALTAVGQEFGSDPNNLGLVYWRVRLLLDTGNIEQARAELVELLPDLPEVALTIRWSGLYEAAGEQELWIRNVLQRIRAGHVVRRSTFRELVRLLRASSRFEDALEVLDRLRAIDPPAPEEEVELSETEMILRVRLAEYYCEDGKFDQAMVQVGVVREHFSGWSAPYKVGFQVLSSQGDVSRAFDFALEGYRNTGQPDLLLLVYERQIHEISPVELLEYWDDHLSDLTTDGWYLLTTGWISLRHGVVEEGVRRLKQISTDDPAYGHGRIVLGGMNIERGHTTAGAEMLVSGIWPWIQIPFLWSCGHCGNLERNAPVVCPQCQEYQSYQLNRPHTIEEPSIAKLVTSAAVHR